MAFITDATRKDAIALVVTTLGSAPSAKLLADITENLTGGATMGDIAAHLTSSAAYLAANPAGRTAAEVASDILDGALVGATVSAEARAEAMDLLTAGLTSGSYTIASATNAVADYLSGPAPAAAFADAAAAFQNRVDAAEDFTKTFTLEGIAVTDAELAAALDGVTSNPFTLLSAKAAYAAGYKSTTAKAAADAEAAAAEAVVLEPSVSSVDEGSAVLFTLDGGAAAAGKTYSYVISGDVDASDITSGSMIGTVVADSNGVAIAQVMLNSDVTTEGAESLTVTMNTKSATVTVNDTSAAPAAQTDFTITAAEIVTNNAIAGNNQMAVTGTDSGTNSVTIQSSAVTSDGGFVYAGDADVTITSGSQNDSITVVSEGDSTVTSGAGDDTITIVGGGSNTINVGAGDDTVTGGSGSDNIVMGSGETGANDVIDGGLGVDTLTISGDGNVIGGAGASLTSIENLVLDGTTLTIAQADLEALTSVSGDITTSEITADVANGATLDLSGVSLTGVKSLTADDNVTVILNATQIGQIGAITTAAGKNLTIDTDVDGLLALGSKATAGTGGAVSITVTDTDANILANSAAIAAAGATPTLSGTSTVAEAAAALASNASITFALSDTAANLALAPTSVFVNAASVTATGATTAVQATQIESIITAANAIRAVNLAAGTVTYNVTDTASNVANYQAALGLADSVTTTGQSTVAQATATNALTGSVYSITDTAAAVAGAAAADLNAAAANTVSGAATVAQIDTINTATSQDVESGYALSDSYANLVTGTSTAAATAATVTASAGNITVTDAGLNVTEARTIEALGNSGTNAYVVADTINNVLTAPSSVVNSATAVSTSDATLTVAQANSLVSKYGAAKVSDASFVISDTAANLMGASAAAIAEAQAANGVVVSAGTATVAQALAINTAAGTKLNKATVDISDTAANVLAATADATNGAVVDTMNSITLSDAATVEQITDINADLAGFAGGIATAEVATGYALTDTAANLLAAGAAGAGGIVDDAGTVTIDGATNVANVTLVQTEMARTAPAVTLGTNLVYSLSDSATNVLAAAAGLQAGATSISVTGTSTGVQAAALVALAKFDDVYTISGNVADIENAAVTAAVQQGAVSVTMTDTVANLEANAARALDEADVDTIIVSDTLAAIGGAAAATITAATSLDVSDNNLTIANAATLNALTKPATYDVVDSFADFTDAAGTAAASDAVETMLAGAQTVTLSDATNTVAQFNVVASLTSGTIVNNAAVTGTTLTISDTIANLATSGAAAAVAAAAGGSVTASDVGTTNATVAQAELLVDYGISIDGIDIVDTSANIVAMSADLVTAIVAANGNASANDTTVSSSDNAAMTLSVAVANAVFDVTGAAAETDGSNYATYTLSDTAANLANANAGLVNRAQAVTVTGDPATYAQAGTLAGLTTMGTPVSYSVTVAAADGITAGAALNSAVDIVASDAQDIADARVLNGATNSGTTSYSISDAAGSFIDAVAATQASISSAVEAATGTVTATGNASLAEAAVIAGLTKAVVFSVSDDETNLADLDAESLNEAVDVTVTKTATALTTAQAADFLAATNSGTTTLAEVSGTASEVLAMGLTDNDVISSLVVTGNITATQAVQIAALEAGANVTALSLGTATISGTSAELALVPDAFLASAAANGVTVTEAMTVAEHTALASAITIGNIDVYNLTDTFTNFMVDGSPDGNVDAKAAILGAAVATVTDSLNVTQALDFLAQGGDVYNLVDTDANIAASLGNDAAVTSAATITNGTVSLDIQSIGPVGATATVISGTKAEIDALSATLQAENVAYEVSVSDLNDNLVFYGNLAANQYISVTDTVANLTSGNALLASSKSTTVTDSATVAQATTIAALSVIDDITYSLTDTAANLTAGAGANSILDTAVNITATDTVTFAQAGTIQGETNSGTTTYSINDVDTNIALVAADINGATDITVTGTAGITAAQATSLVTATNSGNTTIALVTGTPADLATLAGVMGANDTITAATPSAALSVEQVVAVQAKGVSLTAYSLSDTAANLAAADVAVLNGATNIALSAGTATVAEATTIASASNSGTTTYAIADTSSSVLAATVSVLEGDSDDAIVVTDTTMDAATATALTAFDAANNDVAATAAVTEGFTINAGGAAGVFAITDTQSNIVAAANATAAAASTAVVATDAALTVAQAVALEAAAAADATPAYSVTDTYTNILLNQVGAAPIDVSDVSLTITGNLNIAQAKIVTGYGASATTITVSDSATNAAASAANAVVKGSAAVTTSFTFTTAATVAEAATLEAQGVTGYAITDSATAVATALNTVNGAAGTADAGLLSTGSSLTLNTAATVAQATGVADYATETKGLYTISGLSYSISDTVTNIAAGIAGIDGAGVTGAVTIYANDDTAMSIANATTLTSLANFVGYDVPATAAVVETNYYLSDGFVNIMGGDVALIAGAATVTANGTTGDDTINLSMHSRAITIDAGTGVDTITGSTGADTFVITGADTGITYATADKITDFATTSDTLSLGTAGVAANFATANGEADFATALASANTAMDTTVIYYLSTAVAADMGGGAGLESLLFIDQDADGTADDVIVLTGTAGILVAADIVA